MKKILKVLILVIIIILSLINVCYADVYIEPNVSDVFATKNFVTMTLFLGGVILAISLLSLLIIKIYNSEKENGFKEKNFKFIDSIFFIILVIINVYASLSLIVARITPIINTYTSNVVTFLCTMALIGYSINLKIKKKKLKLAYGILLVPTIIMGFMLIIKL